jgi:hypothetical protein
MNDLSNETGNANGVGRMGARHGGYKELCDIGAKIFVKLCKRIYYD